KGQYQGNFLNSLPKSILPETKQMAEELPELLVPHLKKIIGESPLPQHYEGHFGVDILIYRDTDGKLRVNPCLEINLRQNMGLLSLQIEKRIAPGAKGMFKTFYRKGTSFHSFVKKMTKQHPPKMESGKMTEGFFPLTEATNDALFGAYLIAEKSLD
ncbi:MAG: hypothetical protein ACOCWK_04490, partial [Tangfeifania sp.]